MIYRQNKKKREISFYLGVFFWLALAALVFFGASRNFLKTLIVKTAVFLAPERAALENSRKNLAAVLALKNLEEENARLKQSLNIKNNGITIPAGVKFGGGYLFADTLVLDAGENAGVKIGDAVFFEGNILIGKITETGGNWSKVAPAGRLGEKIFLRAEQKSAADKQFAPFEADGLGGGEMMAILPISLGIRAGNVFFWGENQNLIAGIADKIVPEADGQTARIYIVRPVSLESLDYVMIILRND